MKLDTLFKKTSTGAIQTWKCWTEGNAVYTEFGQLDGSKTTSAPKVCTGKQGRSDVEQAEAEARSMWEKKLKGHNYVKSIEAAQAGESDAIVAGGLLPMLAHKFSEHGSKLVYPCFVQPKLDGHRCIGMNNGTLWSRTRKPITGVPHIAVGVADLHGPVLDGELYNHAYHNQFEQLTHFIRQSVPTAGHEVVQYHVYDCVAEGSFRRRWDLLRELFVTGERGQIKLVETREVNDEDELMLAFEDFLSQGYEGAIARNADGLYVGKRSYDLLKIKKFDDAEFPIIGVEEGRGKMAGHGIFVCRAANGSEFRAKMKGEHAALEQFVKHPERFIGKQVTVKYQGLTNYGIPRFPVALRIRENE